ncbi:MAG: hypothetical protein RR483_00440, partial [Clostridia bacterium]
LSTTLAWFIFSKENMGNVQSVQTVPVDQLSFEIYHIPKDNNGNSLQPVKVPSIFIEEYLPNQKEDYYIKIINDNPTAVTVALNFNEITDNFTPTKNYLTTDINLAKMIMIKNLSCDAIFTDNILNAEIIDSNELNNDLFSLSGGESAEKRQIIIASNLKLESKKTGNIYFSFELNKNADNSFQKKTIKIDKIELSKN